MATMYLVTSEFEHDEATFVDGVYTTIPLARAAAWDVLSDDMDKILSVHPVEPDKPIEGMFWYQSVFQLIWNTALGVFWERANTAHKIGKWVEVEDERSQD